MLEAEGGLARSEVALQVGGWLAVAELLEGDESE